MIPVVEHTPHIGSAPVWGNFFWLKLRRGAMLVPAVRLPNFSTGSRSKLLATSNANARKHSDHYSERSGFLRVHYVWTKQNAGQVSSFCTKKRDAQLARRLAASGLGCLIDWALSRRGDPTGSGLSWPRCLTWPWYSYARNPNFSGVLCLEIVPYFFLMVNQHFQWDSLVGVLPPP